MNTNCFSVNPLCFMSLLTNEKPRVMINGRNIKPGASSGTGGFELFCFIYTMWCFQRAHLLLVRVLVSFLDPGPDGEGRVPFFGRTVPLFTEGLNGRVAIIGLAGKVKGWEKKTQVNPVCWSITVVFNYIYIYHLLLLLLLFFIFSLVARYKMTSDDPMPRTSPRP